MKKCSKCLIQKQENSFTPSQLNKIGYSVCIICAKEKSKAHYERNKEKILKRTKEYAQANKDKYVKLQSEWYLKNKTEHMLNGRIWQVNNKDKIKVIKKRYLGSEKGVVKSRAYSALYKKLNKEKLIAYRENNKHRLRQNSKRHYVENKHLYILKSQKRATILKKATPPWLTKDHMVEMNQIYATCPKGFHVDHIIPLQGEIVCGLHVPWNLQHLSASENLRKTNKF